MSPRSMTWLVCLSLMALGLVTLAPQVAQRDALLRTYAPLIEADALIRQRYVQTPDDAALVAGAIRGTLRSLDPYCGYIDAEQWTGFRQQAGGSYVGVGLHLGSRDGAVVVISPTPHGPAANAGVGSGALLLAVDGVSTEGQSVPEVERRLSGLAGTDVCLTLQQQSDDMPTEVTLRRAEVEWSTVFGVRYDADGRWDYTIDAANQIGYVRIGFFHDRTATEFDEALAQLQRDHCKGLILDLRGNPGGALRSGVAVADRFIAEGSIVATVTRFRAVDRYEAHAEGTVRHWPMAVLIDGGSASASEIVAGALQDHKRAVIIGTRSFGKGVVQQILPLSGGQGAVKLTVAAYRLPSGRLIHRSPDAQADDPWGVMPDLIVESTGRDAASGHPDTDAQLAVALDAVLDQLSDQ